MALKSAGWCDLMQADLHIWADFVGWTGLEVLTLDEWKMALVTVLVEVERVKMVVVCRSAGTAVHWESLQSDWIIQKCCVDCCESAAEGGLTVFVGLKLNISCLEVPGCWSSTTK